MLEMPINRKWFFTLVDGSLVMDWGQGLAQDVVSGNLIRYVPKEYDHGASDEELNELVEKGRLIKFDENQVFLLAWG